MKKNIITRKLISIQDISEGKGEAFVAILHDYNDAKVMGKDMRELTDGIRATVEYFESGKGISTTGNSTTGNSTTGRK